MRLAFALAGAVIVTALVVASAIVWLCLTQPVIVADSAARGDAWSVVAAAVSVVVSAVGRVLHRL